MLICLLHLSMDSDRRQSIRVTANLPCRWQIIAADSCKEALLKELGLPSNFTQTGELTQLSEELAHTLHRIEDDTVRAALSLLDQKFELLARQAQGRDRVLPSQDLRLRRRRTTA